MPSAARKGDLTAHGGVIVSGFESVLIEGLPAARQGDNHLCPLCNPGTPPPPHVGGPIAQGSTNVIIGGAAAAKTGDACSCIGPPDCIIQGSASVIIGDLGEVSSNDGITSIAQQVVNSAINSVVVEAGNKSPGNHWIEYQITDESDRPISGIPFQCQHSDNSDALVGRLGANGKLKCGGLTEQGESILQLQSITDIQWSTDQANLSDTVTLSATIVGPQAGKPVTFTIYDLNGRQVTSLTSTVEGKQAQCDWTPGTTQETDWSGDLLINPASQKNTQFYFELQVEPLTARSPVLSCHDWIEIVVPNAKTYIGKSYSLTMSDGNIIRDRLNPQGVIKLPDIIPGPIIIVFNDGRELLMSA